jgi:hypothetical protein
MRAINLDGNRVLNVIIVEDLSFPVEQGTLIEDTSTQETGFAQAGGWYISGRFYPPRPSNEEQAEKRRVAYEKEADPLFFMMQRGEATQEQYQAKLKEIKARYPYYYDADGNLLEAQ